MKQFEDVVVPKRTESKLVTTTCDLCTREITTGRFEVNEVEISCKTGESYPEGGNGVITEIDMCQTCFIEKLIPWLKSQGVKTEPTEWDW